MYLNLGRLIMATGIGYALIEPYALGYFSLGFQNMMENHIPEIRAKSSTQNFRVDQAMVNKYEGDLFAVLYRMAIPSKYHWTIMRLNNMMSPTEFNQNTVNILLPDYEYIDQLFTIYNSTKNIGIG